MVGTFISHAWKRFERSVSFNRDLSLQVFVALIALMIGGYLVLLGLALERIISRTLDPDEPVLFLNGLLLYYFIGEFLFRYFIQKGISLNVQPYLHLPIKRKSLVNFLLGGSVVHLMNLVVLVLFGPFALTAVKGAYTLPIALSWLLSVWLTSIVIHFIVLLFKRKLDDSMWGLLVLVVVSGASVAFDFFDLIKLSDVSAWLFNFAFNGIYLPSALLGLLVMLYIANYRFFIESLYFEGSTETGKQSLAQSTDWDFLRAFGLTGEWINIELKLVLRNKRTRSILMLSIFFLLYGLLFYTDKKYTEGMPTFLIFVGVFITGIFMINYGQFMFSWQGSHFDFTLTRPVSVRKYVESKFIFLTAMTVLAFLLSIPYVYFGWRIIGIHLAGALFNIGINIFVIMNMAMWEPKKIDLTKGSTFNYEGAGLAQWLMVIPLLGGPYLFYLPFSLSGYPNAGLVAIGVVGTLGIALNKFLIGLTADRLFRNRYKIAANFRKE